MKAVILAGGLGTRMSEETSIRPKPMVEIGGKPILWHIMKIYSFYGINEFIVCLGYKGYMIKEYFANYHRHMTDITYDLANNSAIVHNSYSEPWKVTLVNTGEKTMTASRLKKISSYLDKNEDFCLTYGDGVADINISNLIEFHNTHGKLATLMATQPPGRFGALDINKDGLVETFKEKPVGDGGYINGGFFVLSPRVLDYIGSEDDVVWEQAPLQDLASDGELMSFKHDGFWHPMDMLRDKIYLDGLWETGKAPWKRW